MADVLIVDDDPAIRETIDLMLHEAGFVCQQAADGDEALRYLRASASRVVVLLDWMMPRISGQDVLDAATADLHRLGRHAYILLTAAGNALPQALLYLLNYLRVPVIGKPFDIDQLVESVRQAAKQLVDDVDDQNAGCAEGKRSWTDGVAGQVPLGPVRDVVVLPLDDIVRLADSCRKSSYRQLRSAYDAIEQATALVEMLWAPGPASSPEVARHPFPAGMPLGARADA